MLQLIAVIILWDVQIIPNVACGSSLNFTPFAMTPLIFKYFSSFWLPVLPLTVYNRWPRQQTIHFLKESWALLTDNSIYKTKPRQKGCLWWFRSGPSSDRRNVFWEESELIMIFSNAYLMILSFWQLAWFCVCLHFFTRTSGFLIILLYAFISIT